MKNKDVLIKLISVGVFLIVLLLLVVIFSFIKIIIPKKENVDSKKILSQSYSLDRINNVTFDLKKSNSFFIISDNKDLIIVQNTKEERFYLNLKETENELFFEEDSYLINPQKKKYTIYFPKSYLNNITIINGFGEVDINDIKNDFYINNNSGNIKISEAGNIKIKDVSGNIFINDIIGNLEASTSTGNINVENINGRLNIETITGNIRVNNLVSKGDSTLETISGNIDLKMNEKSICKIKYHNEKGKTNINEKICTDSINIINLKNVTGIIYIY